jgi:hypothetical protein
MGIYHQKSHVSKEFVTQRQQPEKTLLTLINVVEIKPVKERRADILLAG